MIQEIETIQIHPVIAAVISLVEHYEQPIHSEQLSPIDKEITESEQMAISPIVTVLLQRVGQTAKSSEGSAALIKAYQQVVRPALFTTPKQELKSTSAAVLTHFATFLSNSLQCIQGSDNIKDDCSEQEIQAPTLCQEQNRTLQQPLLQMLHSVASDLVLATNARSDDEASTLSKKSRTQIVIPCFLRIMEVLFQFALARNLQKLLQPSSSGSNCLANCFLSLLAFGPTRLDPRDVSPDLQEQVKQLEKLQAYPICDNSKYSFLPFWDTDWVWEVLSLEAAAWMDSTDRIVERRVSACWRAFANLVDVVVERNSPKQGGVNEKLWQQHHTLQTTQKQVMSLLGYSELVTMARAHFFGRNMVNEVKYRGQEQTRAVSLPQVSKQELFMGRMRDTRPTESSEKAYETIPSRVFAIVQFFSLLLNKANSLVDSILEEMQPMLFELLHSLKDAHIGIACACIDKLFYLKCGTGSTLIKVEEAFQENLWVAVHATAKRSRVGPAIVLVATAQRRLLAASGAMPKSGTTWLDESHTSFHTSHRRRLGVLQEWFLLLDRHQHRAGGADQDYLVFGLLIAVLGHLYDCHQSGNASAVELGRLGLTCVLPILAETAILVANTEGTTMSTSGDESKEGSSNTTERACDKLDHNPSRRLPSPDAYLQLSLMILANLLVTAHPIMKRHTAESKADSPILLMVKHVATIAVVVCGIANSSEIVAKLQHEHSYETSEIQLQVNEFCTTIIEEAKAKIEMNSSEENEKELE